MSDLRPAATDWLAADHLRLGRRTGSSSSKPLIGSQSCARKPSPVSRQCCCCCCFVCCRRYWRRAPRGESGARRAAKANRRPKLAPELRLLAAKSAQQVAASARLLRPSRRLSSSRRLKQIQSIGLGRVGFMAAPRDSIWRRQVALNSPVQAATLDTNGDH